MLGKIEGRRRRGGGGWDGWMASLTQRTWVWTNSRRRWRTRKPGLYFVFHLVTGSFQTGLCPFCRSPSLSEPSLAFWYNNMLQVHFTLSLTQPQSQPFLQGALVPGSWNCCLEAKIWVLNMLIASGMSVCPGSLGRQSQKNLSAFADLDTHTFMTTFHFYVHLCKLKAMSSHQSFSF